MSNTFKRVSDWNAKAGNLPKQVGTGEYWKSLEDQFKRIQEELNELYDAIVAKNITEVCDAGADLDVVVSGLNYLSGSAYEDLITSVLDNNDLKISLSNSVATNWATFHKDNGTDVYVNDQEFNEVTYYTVKRTEDNKILKYGNFPKVDLTDYVPDPVIEKSVLIKNVDDISEEGQAFLDTSDLTTILLDNLEGDAKDALGSMIDLRGELILTVRNGELLEVVAIKDIQENL